MRSIESIANIAPKTLMEDKRSLNITKATADDRPIIPTLETGNTTEASQVG